jgi:hypothetical protein
MKIEEKLLTFNPDQKDMFNILESQTIHQFRVPTGVGKGYVMILHILNSIINSDNKIFTIASHRLSLNNQHLRELIELSIKLGLIGKVKFLTVGSAALNISKLLQEDLSLNVAFNKSLFDYNKTLDIRSRITSSDIFKSTLSSSQVNQILKFNSDSGFKTIIVTTYNSLDKLGDNELDIIYLDEAHILASNNQDADFKKNYDRIKSKKRFFFTATPKDVEEQYLKDNEASDVFLMNNKVIFGDIYTIPFVKCVKSAYICKPVIHIAHPVDYQDGVNYDSIGNKAKFVTDTFKAHEMWLKSVSFVPNEIEPKVLVRCESVPHMWDMHRKLSEIVDKDIIVCAGASYNDGGEDKHTFGNEWVSNRDEFIKKIQGVKDTQKMIILNFDIFSEGINVPGITGVLFLQGKMPSIAKVIQNIGRATRLHKFDRDRIRKGEIGVNDYSVWVKPYCAVIIPYWDVASEFTKRLLADTVRKLRDSWEFDPHFILSVGDDLANGDGENSDEGLNKLNKGNKKVKLIEEINQEIEKLNEADQDLKEKQYLESLTPEERNRYILEKEFGLKVL